MEAIIIIGAGQAAASCAAKFRTLDNKTPVTIVGNEASFPYQRPPLSKKYLSGELGADRLLLRPATWYEEQNINVITGVSATGIDRNAKEVTLANNDRLGYGKLVIATGSRPRMLPPSMAQDMKGIYAVRSLADVDAMRPEFSENRRLLVIGGGYIGLEAAAIARKFDMAVTLVEAAPRILGRVASPETADFMRSLHQKHGVTIIEGQGIEKLIHINGRVSGAQLSNGQTVVTDFVIVGIGILPNTSIAEDAGLPCDQGILIDEHCRTEDPDIYAAGDVTRFYHNGQLIRLESVGNAIDQGEIVGLNIAGETTPYKPRPWFWSDQYDYTLQIAGLNMGYDATVTRPGLKSETQSVWYFREDQLLSVDAMNDPRAYMMGKKIIEAGKTIPKHVASDPNTNLKDWL